MDETRGSTVQGVPARSDAFAKLSRALVDAGHQLPRILDALTTSLTASLCDRCAIELSARTGGEPAAARHTLSPRHAILVFSGTRLLHGSVTVMRDDESPAFEPRELADIETCIAFATLAAELVIHLEAERAALRAEHDRAEQFYRTMLGVVGHDMRAPVSAILIGTEMLIANRQDDPALAGVVSRIVSFANRMTGMVDQLLDLGRAQLGGGIPLARTELRLAPVIESVIEELADRYPRNRFSLSGDAELKGAWDPDRLRQVAASLVTNAVRHGLKDGPINIFMSQDEGSTKFAVHNEICEAPIPQEAMPELFQPYRRSHEEHGGAGLGLGLYIVREIVQAHGGRVAVDSTAAGTTFRVVIPNYK
jgi:signal transduction histidine kinase